jgi:hypothetical protein
VGFGDEKRYILGVSFYPRPPAPRRAAVNI